jgi:hypothetical protein
MFPIVLQKGESREKFDAMESNVRSSNVAAERIGDLVVERSSNLRNH